MAVSYYAQIMDDMEDLEDLIALEEVEELAFLERLQRPRRVFRDRSNPIEYLGNVDFVRRYRFTKTSVLALLGKLEPVLQFPTNRNNPLTPALQVLVTLRFFACGTYYMVLEDLEGFSKATAARTVAKVSRAIARLLKECIQFPGTEEQQRKVAADFYEIKRFPGCLGIVDCTHIPIASPGGSDVEMFRCTKGYFSINVQTISDANLYIRDLVVRYQGSVPDNVIFNQSAKQRLFETGKEEVKSHLLGDEAYVCRPYLLTPLAKPVAPAERRYNAAHKATHSKVKQLYDIWKRRFPCLKFGLHVSLNTALAAIVAMGVLHNFALDQHEEDPTEDAEVFLHQNRGRNIVEQPETVAATQSYSKGNAARRRIINQHFS